MAIINETGDATINAYASGSYNINEGDVFNGNLGVGDHEDGINLNGLTPGTTYTVSLTVDDLAGFSGMTLINRSDFHSVTMHVSDGVPHDHYNMLNGWVRNFVETSGVSVDLSTNTISFDFTPQPGFTSFAFQVQGSGVAEAYSVTFAETVLENVIDGTNAADNLRGTDGIDHMQGGAGNDKLFGEGDNDIISGGGDKDQLSGGAGNDTVSGDSGNDLIFGGADDDVLNGGANNDRVYGDGGNDTVNGDAGNDKLWGGDGDDVINGGTGKDVMTGGAGADVFVMAANSHRDTITDFEDGVDMLDFTGHGGVAAFGDLNISQNGNNVVIDHGGPAELTLLNTNVIDIDATDFLF
ncbi:calcium-binding protein [uncultured Tateyamaria sp.]|uniref:calcium-binding protein n=1 Tax=uncultured Tateyamaria sp. TaxID=455651 RepID=UPI0026256827|nr:calcium-binding protein [uncultured Tateyamaria sp.]